MLVAALKWGRSRDDKLPAPAVRMLGMAMPSTRWPTWRLRTIFAVAVIVATTLAMPRMLRASYWPGLATCVAMYLGAALISTGGKWRP